MQSVKKVLHLLWDGSLGGVQRYVKQVFSSQKWEGYKHYIFIFTEAGDILNQQLSGVIVECAHLKSNKELFKCHKILKRVLIEYDIDFIHSHCDTLLYLTQLPLFKRYKNVYTEHGDSFVRENRQGLTKLLWKTNGRYWDKIILNSNYTKKTFIEKYSSLANKAQVIANPLLDDVKTTNRSINHKLKIGSIGRLETVKGNDLFLNALPKVFEKYPNLQVELYGEGSEKENLKNQAEKLSINDNIKFKGFTNEPIEIMKSFDCLVVPSRKESFGLVALEALSIGTPVVAFKETGISDFLVNGKHGHLTAMGDLDELSENIIKTISNAKEWTSLSRSGVEMVKEKYGLCQHIKALEDCYRQL